MYSDQKAQVDFERIVLLYSNNRLALFGITVSLLVLTFAVRNLLPLQLLAAWFILTLLSIVPWVMVMSAFRNRFSDHRITQDNILGWEKFWAFGSAPYALALVSLAYFPFQENELIAVLFVGLVILGMLAGNIISSNTSLLAVKVYFNCSCIPFILRCFIEQDEMFTVLGVFYTGIYLGFTGLYKRLNHVMLNSLRLEIQNRENALIDSLTGLWNRRGLFPYVEQLIRQTRRSHEVFSVIMLDIDHFKITNDTLGHAAGDRVLMNVADCIRRCTREGDMLIRYGGEEFLVVLPATDKEQAANVAERILKMVREKTSSTISAGVAQSSTDKDFDGLVAMADQALYQAKNSGRDRTAIAE